MDWFKVKDTVVDGGTWLTEGAVVCVCVCVLPTYAMLRRGSAGQTDWRRDGERRGFRLSSLLLGGGHLPSSIRSDDCISQRAPLHS